MLRIINPKPAPITLMMLSNNLRMIQLNVFNGFYIIKVSHYQKKLHYNHISTIIECFL